MRSHLEGKPAMNRLICECVENRREPDFFDHPDDRLKAVHEAIQTTFETATETMEIALDQALKERVEKLLSKIGWTLEEAFILYLYWCITCPDSADAWLKRTRNGDKQECSISQETPTESSAASNGSAKE